MVLMGEKYCVANLRDGDMVQSSAKLQSTYMELTKEDTVSVVLPDITW